MVFKHWACRLLGHKLGHNAHGEPGHWCKRCGHPLTLGLAAVAARNPNPSVLFGDSNLGKTKAPYTYLDEVCIKGKLDLKPEPNNADSETP